MKMSDTKNKLNLLPAPTPAGKGATKHLIKTPVILGKQRGSSFESDWDVFVGTATVFGGGDICRFVSQVSGGCSHLNGSVLYAPSVSELRFYSLWIAPPDSGPDDNCWKKRKREISTGGKNEPVNQNGRTKEVIRVRQNCSRSTDRRGTDKSSTLSHILRTSFMPRVWAFEHKIRLRWSSFLLAGFVTELCFLITPINIVFLSR